MILTTIIDHLYRVGHELAIQPNDLSPTVAEERIEAGKSVIEKISKIKYEMGRDKPLLYDSINDSSSVPGGNWNSRVLGRPLVDDGEPSIRLFNQELAALEAQGKNTWATTPWLFAESATFLYRSVSFNPQRQLLDSRCYLYVRSTPPTHYPTSDNSSGTNYFEATLSRPKP